LALDYVILSDPSGKTAKQYGIYNEDRGFSKRVTFVISKEGKILAVEEKISVDSHASDLAKMLGELNVDKR
jgi:peroxiredoxin